MVHSDPPPFPAFTLRKRTCCLTETHKSLSSVSALNGNWAVVRGWGGVCAETRANFAPFMADIETQCGLKRNGELT